MVSALGLSSTIKARNIFPSSLTTIGFKLAAVTFLQDELTHQNFFTHSRSHLFFLYETFRSEERD